MSDIKIQMDPTQKILLKRLLNKDGQAQVRFTRECAKAFNNYTPFDSGRLKDMTVKINTSNVTYSANYAKKQYYCNQGMGKQGTSVGGLRGKYWDKRCWMSNGDKIIKTIADFVGGRSQ
jgi:hypothetical protein